jgi:hypothetical protein
LTGEGADVSEPGRDGDDRDAAGVGCYRRSSSAGIRAGAAFDALTGTWATETTRPLIVAVVPGSLTFRVGRCIGDSIW